MIDYVSKSYKHWTKSDYKLNNALSYNRLESKAFNNKGHGESLSEKRFDFNCQWPMVMTYETKGKFQPKWEGPFMVETVYSNGAYNIENSNNDTFMILINGKFLKKYYPWSR